MSLQRGQQTPIHEEALTTVSTQVARQQPRCAFKKTAERTVSVNNTSETLYESKARSGSHFVGSAQGARFDGDVARAFFGSM